MSCCTRSTIPVSVSGAPPTGLRFTCAIWFCAKGRMMLNACKGFGAASIVTADTCRDGCWYSPSDHVARSDTS